MDRDPSESLSPTRGAANAMGRMDIVDKQERMEESKGGSLAVKAMNIDRSEGFWHRRNDGSFLRGIQPPAFIGQKSHRKAYMTQNSTPPVFCEKYCVICRGARAGNSLCRALQKLELALFGKKGCFWGRARTRYYGVTPDQPLPQDVSSKGKSQD